RPGRGPVGEDVGAFQLLRRVGGGLLRSRVDLAERLALRNPVPALSKAQDAYGVVDLVVLGLAPRSEVQRGLADADRSELRHVPRPRGCEPAHDGRGRQGRLVGVTSLRTDPALVGLDRGPVRERALDALAGLGFVDAEI